MSYPIEQDYDETVDAIHGGDLSLDIGAGFYRAAMDEQDAGERARLFQRASHWYERSAGLGNAQAATNLGYVYLYGRIGGVDAAQAFHWFSVGADLGNAESCYKLGDLHRAGKGCARDFAKARELYGRAAKLAGDSYDPSEPQDAAILASIELRLAGARERSGKARDREAAHEHYVHAAELFEIAVGGGLGWYARTLESARAGAARTGSTAF